MEIHLRLSDSQATDSLLEFFHRREMTARRLGDDRVAVELPHDLHEQQARMELDLLLRRTKTTASA
jgi:hypothetical protein